MFATPLPEVDFVLLSNVLHDWDIPECRDLVQRCADSLRPNGRLLIHHVLLNDLSRDHVSMHDCLPESEVRTKELAPQSGHVSNLRGPSGTVIEPMNALRRSEG